MIISEVSSGITHIEDLPTIDFCRIVRDLESCYLTEKLDGAQILFGVDENGFYTSRESKGGTRIYNDNDYEIKFSTTYMRAAHKALESVWPLLQRAGLTEGNQIEAEVLFGELPNVVPYSSECNRIVFLRTTSGDVSIKRIAEELSNMEIYTSLEVPHTSDGRIIVTSINESRWEYSQVPEVAFDLRYCRKELSSKLSSIVGYLKGPSGVKHFSNFIIENTPLNKRPDWCDPSEWCIYKDLIKEKREEIRQYVQEVKLEIKDLLLENLVRNKSSKFGPLMEDGGWIEGVVIKSPTGKVTKLVDKSTFGKIRESAWSVRNSLTDKAKGVDSKAGFVGEMYVQMATAIGHPELGTMQAKNYLRKNTLTEDTVDFQSVKDYWLNLLTLKEGQLEEKLKKYEKDNTETKVLGNYRVNEERGARLPSHVQRTMQTFAEIFEQISNFKENIRASVNVQDLYRILVGKHMDEIS